MWFLDSFRFREGSEVQDDLPDLGIRQLPVSGHARFGRPITDDPEQLPVRNLVQHIRAGEVARARQELGGNRPVAVSLQPVAHLAGRARRLLVELASGRDPVGRCRLRIRDVVQIVGRLERRALLRTIRARRRGGQSQRCRRQQRDPSLRTGYFSCHNLTVIRITVNGSTRALERPLDVAALLATLALTGKKVAVERNGEIVPRSAHGSTMLLDGDQLEIVVAVGGG